MDVGLVSELFEEMMETDEYGWIGSQRHRFEPFAVRHPALVELLLDRYAALLVRFGRFPPERTRDVRESLSLTVPVEASQDVIRSTSNFTGETRWVYDWDKSADMAQIFVEEEAHSHAEWAHTDRVWNGPTEWDEV